MFKSVKGLQLRIVRSPTHGLFAENILQVADNIWQQKCRLEVIALANFPLFTFVQESSLLQQLMLFSLDKKITQYLKKDMLSYLSLFLYENLTLRLLISVTLALREIVCSNLFYGTMFNQKLLRSK